MKTKELILLSFSLLFLGSCTKASKSDKDVLPTDTTGVVTDTTGVPKLTMKTILTGYEVIWGMDFLPNGDLIFTERQGKIYRRSNQTVTLISGFPQVADEGQGGLLDIRVHPDYSNNGWIYASFSIANPTEKGELLRLIRFKIINDQVQNIENLFTTNGSDVWHGHFGSRILFDKDKNLYLSIGEGGVGTLGGPNTVNNNAQDLTSSWGKIHRMKDDGTIPSDNPIIGNAGRTTVFTYGHRNPQGLAINPNTGKLWEAEHGPKGGDEINILTGGLNYGWPMVSLGVNYDGTKISDGHTGSGITPPIFSWTPSIAVCGITFITSDKFKSWKGSLLVSALAGEKLTRCIVNGNTIVRDEVVLSDSGRVRNVVQAPDGSIYVSVEGPGRIIQIIPE